MVTVSLMVLVTGDGVQVAPVTPFQRPAGVDPTEHRNFCMAHVARLPECCVNSEPASGTDSHLNSQWSDVIQPPSFDYSPLSRGKFRRDVNIGGKVADRPVAVVSRYMSDAASQELPDLETTERLRYRNHDWVTTRKNRLPLSGKNTLPSSSMVAQQKGGLSLVISSRRRRRPLKLLLTIVTRRLRLAAVCRPTRAKPRVGREQRRGTRVRPSAVCK